MNAYKLTATGAGNTDALRYAIRDTDGTSILPLQAHVEGDATFNINGRVSGEAPWLPLKEDATADFLESFSYIPHLQLEITAGSGTVTLWIGDK